MADFLDTLAQSARATIDSGYYENAVNAAVTSTISLKQAILEAKNAPVITEIKAASPSAGTIRKNVDASLIAESMEKGAEIYFTSLHYIIMPSSQTSTAFHIPYSSTLFSIESLFVLTFNTMVKLSLISW